MEQIIDVVRAVEAVTRIPSDFKDVTYFSENDLWDFVTKDDPKVCPICNELEFGSPFQGNHLRRWFAGHPYADMVILDRNTIGGPAANGDGLMHPNCRCRLRRVIKNK